MSYIPNLYGQIDSNNSTSSILTANSVFTGTSTIVTNFANVVINLTTDQDSASDGLSVQFSQDNTNWDSQNNRTIQIATTTNLEFEYLVTAKYFRIVYTNGTVDQTVFRLQCLLNAQAVTVLSGTSTGLNGTSTPLTCDYSGKLNVSVKNGNSSFGDIRVVQPYPLMQFDFVYGLNTNLVSTTTAVSGTATASGGMAVMTTAVTSNSYIFYRYNK
jgi:hypothetical protein